LDIFLKLIALFQNENKSLNNQQWTKHKIKILQNLKLIYIEIEEKINRKAKFLKHKSNEGCWALRFIRRF